MKVCFCDRFVSGHRETENLRANCDIFREIAVFMRAYVLRLYFAKVFDTSGYRATAVLL